MARSRGSQAGFVVLMTACIAPKLLADGSAPVLRSDPDVRRRDYAEGLRFWLELKDSRFRGVVFADNSGASLASLRTLASSVGSDRPVEFLSFDAPPPPVGMSYGYSEFLLVRTALAQSELLRTGTHFIKATGRYRFPAISPLLDQLPTSFRAAVDARGWRPPPWRSNPMVPAALTLFERRFYENELADLPLQMRPAPPWDRCQFIEPMLYDALIRFRNDPSVVLRWPINCEPEGIGGDGSRYDSPRQHLARAGRATLRRLAPNWWI